MRFAPLRPAILALRWRFLAALLLAVATQGSRPPQDRIATAAVPSFGTAGRRDCCSGTQGRAHAQDHILVKLKHSPRSAGPTARAIGGSSGLWAVPLDKGVDVEAALAEYSQRADVEYAVPDQLLFPDSIPSDPLFPSQWHLGKISAPSAWASSVGKGDVTVCIVDSGIDHLHPDLAPNMHPLIGWNAAENSDNVTDDIQHGTHIAGIIGAATNNGIGVAGINWKVKLLACKFIDSSGVGQSSNAIACIHYCAAAGAKIISASWSGAGDDLAMAEAIAAAGAAGALFVASAGNRASNIDAEPNYPASFNLPNMLVVASTGQEDGLSRFSNYGAASVQLGAPGEWILSTIPQSQGGTAAYSGTSMAVPMVSGAAALLMSAAGGKLKVDILRQLLLDSTDPVEALKGRTTTGGRLNAASAIRLYLERRVVKPESPGCKRRPGRCELRCNAQSVCRWVRRRQVERLVAEGR